MKAGCGGEEECLVEREGERERERERDTERERVREREGILPQGDWNRMCVCVCL